jgi:hypothetical protein
MKFFAAERLGNMPVLKMTCDNTGYDKNHLKEIFGYVVFYNNICN